MGSLITINSLLFFSNSFAGQWDNFFLSVNGSISVGLYLKRNGKKSDGANKFLIKNNSEMKILHAKLLYKTQSCDIQHPQSATELHFQNLRKITTQE